MNVRLATIGDYVEPIATWNPATKPTDAFIYVDLGAVDQIEKQITSTASVLGSEAPSRARQMIKKGDILVSTVRPNLNGVAAVTENLDGATASTGFCVLRPRPEKLSSNYLMHWVRSPQFIDLMIKQATGASYPAVSDRIVKGSLIPLPPLDEQRRIAAILDKADTLRRKRKRTLDLLETLTQSIFQEMFGDPFARESAFRRVAFGAVTSRITYGFTQPMSHHDEGIPILTAKNIRLGYIDFENVAYADRGEFDALTAKSKPSKFDILITKDGAIGRSACVLSDDEICINQSVALVKPRLDLVDPLYLLHYLLSTPVQAQIDSMKKGNAMPHLQITELAKFPVFLPSLDLQRKFVSRLRMTLKQEARQKAGDQKSQSLFSSLQSRAFLGQL